MSDLMPIKDIAGFSKPAKELIKSISNAIGVMYEPRRIREKAKAEADASIILEEADAERNVIRWQAQQRINHLEERRQKNINQIIGNTIKQLTNGIKGQPLEEDWLVQFFIFSQDVSNEELQLLWARILAGEFVKPNSFSLRTLSKVKMLSQANALAFNQFCRYLWNGNYLFYIEFNEFEKLSIDDTHKLKYLGLVEGHEWPFGLKKEGEYLRYFGQKFLFTPPVDGLHLLRFYGLTDVGLELLPLCDIQKGS